MDKGKKSFSLDKRTTESWEGEELSPSLAFFFCPNMHRKRCLSQMPQNRVTWVSLCYHLDTENINANTWINWLQIYYFPQRQQWSHADTYTSNHCNWGSGRQICTANNNWLYLLTSETAIYHRKDQWHQLTWRYYGCQRWSPIKTNWKTRKPTITAMEVRTALQIINKVKQRENICRGHLSCYQLSNHFQPISEPWLKYGKSYIHEWTLNSWLI